jgi:hypothetical protein
MSDFWPEKKEKKPKESGGKVKKTRSVDGIKVAQKSKPKAKQLKSTIKRKSKFIFWTALFLIFAFCLSIVFSGYLVVAANKNKLNILKLFRNGKYLVLFQNNAEMRPTGGFIGSFAVIEIADFKVKNIDFNSNIYKLDHDYMATHYIEPPAPIASMNWGSWALRDSNYAISYPESAKQIEWFYNQETGDKVDGVIALNASVVKDLLKITGQINLESYDTAISADNFFTELTRQIERNYYDSTTGRDANEPKTILKDLMPKLAHQILVGNKARVMELLYNEIKEKQILFYSNNTNIENSILAENWGGEVKDTNGDYLAVNVANLDGGKSSLNVSESLDYNVNNTDNKPVAKLTITRTHLGSYTWPDGINKNYVRVLVPNGSVLNTITLNNKDISSQVSMDIESGKTTFGFFTATAPGTSDVVKLNYNLPISILNKKYQLLIQKQPGNLGDDLVVKYNDKILFNGILSTDKTIKSK